MYRLLLASCWILLLNGMAFAQDGTDYPSSLENGIEYFERGNYNKARNSFQRAKQYGKRISLAAFEEASIWLDSTSQKLIAIARQNEAIARRQRAEAIAAREAAESAERVALANAQLARAAEKEAIRQEQLALRERDASIARHLAFGAVEAETPDTALYLAYHALKREFTRDTLYPGVRKAFGDAVYRYSRTPVYQPEDSLEVRDFFCVPQQRRVVVLSARQLADTVAGPDRLEAWSLPKEPSTGRLPAAARAVTYDLPPDYRVRTLAFARNGERFVTGSTDGQLVLWATHSARPLDSVTLIPPDPIHAISFTTDQRFVIATEGGALETWTYQMDRLEKQEAIPGSEDAAPIYSIGFTARGDRFFTRGAGPQVRIWSPGQTRPDAELAVAVYAYEAALHPDGNRLLIADATGAIELWDIATQQRRGALSCSQDTVTRFAFAEGGKRAFFLEKGGRVTVADADLTDANCRTFTFNAEVTTARFAPGTDSLLLLGFTDGRLRLLDTSADRLATDNREEQTAVKMAVDHTTGKAIRKVDFTTDASYWLALDERGQLILCAGYDTTYRWLQTPPIPQLSDRQRQLFLGETAPAKASLR